jgi:hypothetical protein
LSFKKKNQKVGIVLELFKAKIQLKFLLFCGEKLPKKLYRQIDIFSNINFVILI